MALSYKNDENSDDRLNPAELNEREQITGTRAGEDTSQKNTTVASSNTPASIDQSAEDIRDQEENSYYNQSSNPTATAGKSRLKGAGRFLKRKSILTTVIALFIGGFGGFMVLFSPSLAVVHMKEVLMDDLNDQVTAMDVRGSSVFRSKFKSLGKPLSSCKLIKVRCGLKGMTDRQIRNFRNAGIDVETIGDKKFGKTGIKSLTFTDDSGKKIRVASPADFNKFSIDRSIRAQLRRAYNPRFMSLSDSVMGKIRMLGSFKFSKHDRLGDDPKQFDENMKRAIDGDYDVSIDSERATSGEDATEEEKQRNAAANAELEKQTELLKGSTGFSGVLKGFGKGIGVTGTIDSACTLRSLSMGVEAGAKVIRAKQLAEFSMVFMVFADSVKAGTATVEQSDYINSKLSAIDNQATVVNETSPVVNGKAQAVDNPNYGKNAYDSAGMRTAMYNDAPSLSASDQQFMTGGAMVGTLAVVNNQITKLLGGRDSARKKCKIVQNAAVRIGSTIGGILLGIGSGGASLAISIGASLAFAAAAPILAGYLKDMIAGKVVSSKTDSVDAGNAIFVGSASILGAAATARGLKPLSSPEIKSYLTATNNVKNEYIAADTEAAKKTPFDVMNRYSFLGSLARSLNPSATHLRSNTSLALSQLPALFATAFRSSSDTAHAVGDFNPERFTKCNDEAYEYLRIDADVFCNVRYGLSAKEMAMDPEDVMQALYDRNDIDEEGQPVSDSEYSDWLTECTQRVSGWGEPEEDEENQGLGEQCVGQLPKYKDVKYSWFRVYTVDQSIIEGMDNGPTDEVVDSTAAATSVSVASYNIRNIHQGDGETLASESGRYSRIATIIKSKGIDGNGIDIVGMQEVEGREEYNYFSGKLSGTYGIYPSNLPASVSQATIQSRMIIYRKDKFELVKEEGIDFRRQGVAAKAPVVWLKNKETQQVFIVINTHNPSNAWSGRAAVERADAADAYASKIKALKETNLPIIFTGDFNEGYGVRRSGNTTLNGDWRNLFYCKAINAGLVISAEDRGKKIDCVRRGAGGVDYIYTSPEVTVDSYERIEKPASATDHPVPYAVLSTKGSDSASEAGGWVGDESKQGFQWPAKSGRVSNCWRLPIDRQDGHAGIDISVPIGTPVYAAKEGTVVMSGYGGDAGNVIMLKHSSNLWSNYQHNGKLLVSVGDTVKKGQVIARSGNTGYTTGPHIHFGITDEQTLSSRKTLYASLKPTIFLPPRPAGIGGITCL